MNDLEAKVKDLEKKNSELEERLSTLQNENQMLRQVRAPHPSSHHTIFSFWAQYNTLYISGVDGEFKFSVGRPGRYESTI